MPFLGVQPTDTFAAVAKQTITGDGSTTYTLTHSVASANDLAVFVNNVRQEPTTAYSASGTSITFTEAIASTDSCYVVYIARTFQTLSPPDNSVNADQISYPLTNFSSTGIDDNATSTAVTIDSSERVGIGATSPAHELHIAGTEPNIRLESGGTPSALYGLEITNGSTVDGYFRSRGATGETQIGSGRSSGWGGHITFYTDASERMRILSGGGITFNGDTAAANALDDYEEGTFTPSLVPTSGSFGSITYSFRNGYYTKIGNVVNACLRIDTSSMSIGSASGYLRIHGFPYTAHGSAYQSIVVGYSYGYSSVWPAGGAMGGGTTTSYLYAVDAYNNTASVVPSNLGTGQTYLYVSVAYKTT